MILYQNIKNAKLFLRIKSLYGSKSHLHGFIEISSKNRVTYTQIGMHWISQELREGKLKEVEIDEGLGKLHGRKIFKALFQEELFKGWQ